METTFIIPVVFQVMAGIGLAASAGYRAFLPLFIIGLLDRLSFIPYELVPNEHFQWITSDTALVVFGAATLMEMLGDKFPAVDHFLDSINLFLRPMGGALVAAAVLNLSDPLNAYIYGIIAGGIITLPLHLFKAGLRVASSTFTIGVANPLMSLLEDFISTAGALISAFIPWLAFILVVLAMMVLIRWFKRRRLIAQT